EFPRLCRGGSRSLTFTGVHRDFFLCEPPSTRKGQITMDEFESLSHTKWECKYHVVFIPKYRRKVLYGELKKHLGPIFRQLAEQRESRIEEGHLMSDHVYDAVDPAEICGQSDGRVYQGQERDPSGASLWREEARLRRPTLLGSRVLRLDRRSRRNGHPGIYQEPREGRPAAGSNEPLAVTRHLQVAQ